jgi:hypothetical protein
MIERALAVDTEGNPHNRLANLVAQRRARRLLKRRGIFGARDASEGQNCSGRSAPEGGLNPRAASAPLPTGLW